MEATIPIDTTEPHRPATVATHSVSGVPSGLDPWRAWRWCMLTTLREARRARRRGRPISQPNLERTFARRWARTAPHCFPDTTPAQYEQWQQRGRMLVRNGPMICFTLRQHRRARASII